MKWLALLLASVALLVVAWFLFGPGAVTGPQSTLHIPLTTAEKPDLVAAAAQLEQYLPTPQNVAEGVRLLAALHGRLNDEEWVSVQKYAFIGWEKLKRTPGAQPGIEPMAEELLARFARWGSKAELTTLIRSSNASEYWRPQIELGLGRVARTPVPASGYRGSRLEEFVSSAISLEDFERAHAALSRAAWESEISEEAKVPALRLERILGLYVNAKAGKPNFPAIAEAWAAQPPDGDVRLVAEKAGVRVARAGREARNWHFVTQGMEQTKDQATSPAYWEAIAGGVAKETALGVCMEEETLAALVSGKTYEAAFWEKLTAQTPGKTFADASWRASCWGHVIRASQDPARREAAFSKLLVELLPYDPRGMRKALETWRSTVGDTEAARAFAQIEPQLTKREGDLAQMKAKAEQDKRKAPLRSELDWLKSQLGSVPTGKLDPQVAANLRRRISEIEKQLAH